MKNIFNRNLRIFRKQKGLSQRELAKLLNTTHRMITYYENETNSVPVDKLNLIAKVLGVMPGDLVNPISEEKKKIENIDIRILKKYHKILNLPERDQRAINNHINALIEKNRLKKFN